KRSNLLIGTSGWSYGSWRDPFFPHDLPKQGWLEFYARQSRTTELNGVFYRTPTAEAIRGLEERAPEGFIFAWKASRFITIPRATVSPCWKTVYVRLVKKQARFCFNFSHNLKGPRAPGLFLRLLSPQRRYAFEFRSELVWR